MNNRNTSAFTLIELLIAIALMSLLLAMTSPIFFYSKKSNEMMKELDIYHISRKVNHEISSELKRAVKILYPPSKFARKRVAVNQLIYTNSLNQVVVIYVNKKHQLIKVNYDDIENNTITKFRKLGSNIKLFSVTLPEFDLLQFVVSYSLPNKKEYIGSNMIRFVNAI